MEQLYKIKPGYILRSFNNTYMVVAIGPAAREFNGMIRLNESGAFIFKELQAGISIEQLAQKMVDRYEGLSKEKATADIHKIIDQLSFSVKTM